MDGNFGFAQFGKDSLGTLEAQASKTWTSLEVQEPLEGYWNIQLAQSRQAK